VSENLFGEEGIRVGLKLFTCEGGHILLPDRTLVLVSREDGGNLIVIPPREVWERSELTPAELTRWSFLVAATGKAMLDVLPQLEGGCINYWEAGNWALNDGAEPVGPKTAQGFRKVHIHLLGRSRTASSPSWKWGEAPKFPDFAERHVWAQKFERLTAEECLNILTRVETILKSRYEMTADQLAPWSQCSVCRYPTPLEQGQSQNVCAECRHSSHS
jgi:diadenosine tetraphosphate (Ap4A) HIT family hydrolase